MKEMVMVKDVRDVVGKSVGELRVSKPHLFNEKKYSKYAKNVGNSLNKTGTYVSPESKSKGI